MEGFLQDLRHGVRLLMKSPGFTFAAVVTLGLGIGANSAIFSVVNGVLLHPLPYPDPDRLVSAIDVQEHGVETPASYPEYLDWRDQSRVFDELAADFDSTYALTGDGEPTQVRALRVSTNLLGVLGVRPELGRGFLLEEEKTGGADVAILAHGLWQSRFGADPNIIGRKLNLDGRAYTAIGVLPAGFEFSRESDIWVPLRLDQDRAPRGLHFMGVVGRLRAGVDLPRARGEMEVVAQRLQKDGATTHGVKLVSLHDQRVGPIATTLLLLQGAVGFVLLIACTNVANLTLSRCAGRRGEIAVRLALGAGRGRLVRQLLTESVLLALLGGCLALLLAWWGVDVGVAAVRASLPGGAEIHVNMQVMAFTLGLSILTGLLFGLAPAWHSTSSDLQSSLKEGGRDHGAHPHRSRLRNRLVVSEVALSLVLLVGAGLLVRSFLKVMSEPVGFDPSHVLALDVNLSAGRYAGPARQTAFFSSVLERISGLPGVESAGIANNVPLGGNGTNGGITIEGRTYPTGSRPITEKNFASPGYFRTMRIPVTRGRDFDEHDTAEAPKVAIINEAMAKTYFRGEDPLGKRIRFLWGTDDTQTIVGVIGDTKHYELEEAPLPATYLPFAQRTDTSMTIVLRSSSAPTGLAGTIREQILALDRDQPVTNVRTMDRIVTSAIARRRLSLSLFVAFAAAALLLAALGIYGVMSYSVAQRTHEIGLRMALGARAADVLGLLFREGIGLTAAGIALGLAGALALTHVISGLLFGVSSTDPLTFLLGALILGFVALLAIYVPARRAARVDPMIALRHE